MVVSPIWCWCFEESVLSLKLSCSVLSMSLKRNSSVSANFYFSYLPLLMKSVLRHASIFNFLKSWNHAISYGPLKLMEFLMQFASRKILFFMHPNLLWCMHLVFLIDMKFTESKKILLVVTAIVINMSVFSTLTIHARDAHLRFCKTYSNVSYFSIL